MGSLLRKIARRQQEDELLKLADLVECARVEGKVPGDCKMVLAGWKILMSLDKGTLPLHEPDEEHWHLSASLHPLGRSSVESDWNTLGKIMALACQFTGFTEDEDEPDPEDDDDEDEEADTQREPTLLTDFDDTDPNAVHHWCWHADGKLCPLKDVMKAEVDRIHGNR